MRYEPLTGDVIPAGARWRLTQDQGDSANQLTVAISGLDVGLEQRCKALYEAARRRGQGRHGGVFHPLRDSPGGGDFPARRAAAGTRPGRWLPLAGDRLEGAVIYAIERHSPPCRFADTRAGWATPIGARSASRRGA